jgi:hypothetical protein
MILNRPGTFNATLVFPQDLTAMFTTSKNGSDGLLLDLLTDDGDTIQHTVWLTSKTYDKAIETLDKVFGFNGDFKALANGQPFPRTRCSIVVELEDYTTNSGKVIHTPKVKWLNLPIGSTGTSDVGGFLQRVARLSGGDPAPGSRHVGINEAAPLEDENIPF